MIVRADYAVSACSPPLHQRPTLSINVLTPCLLEAGSRPSDRCLPPSLLYHCQLPASEMKQTFLSTNLSCLLAFKQQSSQTPYSYPFCNNWVDECAPPPARPMTWIEGRGTGKQLVIQTLPGGFTLNIVWRMFPKRVSLCELSSHPRNYFYKAHRHTVFRWSPLKFPLWHFYICLYFYTKLFYYHTKKNEKFFHLV